MAMKIQIANKNADLLGMDPMEEGSPTKTAVGKSDRTIGSDNFFARSQESPPQWNSMDSLMTEEPEGEDVEDHAQGEEEEEEEEEDGDEDEVRSEDEAGTVREKMENQMLKQKAKLEKLQEKKEKVENALEEE